MLKDVKKSIFRNTVSRIVFGIIISTIGILVIIATQLSYYTALLTGGTHLTTIDLETHQSNQPLHFAHIQTDSGIDSGYYYESSINFIPYTTDHYGVILPINGQRLILTQSGDPLPDIDSRTEMVGSLKPLTSELLDEIVTPILADLRAEGYTDIEFSAYYLDMMEAENWFLALIGLVITLSAVGVGIWFVAIGVDWLISPRRHPIWVGLSRYPSSPEDIVSSIEMDLAAGNQMLGDITVSRRWLSTKSPGKFTVMRLSDMVWIIGSINQANKGVEFYITLRDRYGVEIKTDVMASQYEKGLKFLQSSAPWALTGTNQQAVDVWKKNRAEFIRQIDERKRQLREEQPS